MLAGTSSSDCPFQKQVLKNGKELRWVAWGVGGGEGSCFPRTRAPEYVCRWWVGKPRLGGCPGRCGVSLKAPLPPHAEEPLFPKSQCLPIQGPGHVQTWDGMRDGITMLPSGLCTKLQSALCLCLASFHLVT